MIVITLIIIYYIQHNKYMFVNSDKTRKSFFLLQVRASGEDEKKKKKNRAREKKLNLGTK